MLGCGKTPLGRRCQRGDHRSWSLWPKREEGRLGKKKRFPIQLRQIPSRALQSPKRGLGVSHVQAQSCCSFPHSRLSANVIPYQGCPREEGKARFGRTLAAPLPGQPREQRASPAGSGPSAPGALRPWGPGGLGCEAVRGVTLVTIAGWSVFFSETCLCNLMYFRNCWGVQARLISAAVITGDVPAPLSLSSPLRLSALLKIYFYQGHPTIRTVSIPQRL